MGEARWAQNSSPLCQEHIGTMGLFQWGLDTPHQRYLHFYTHVALRNSENTSWSKAEGVGFHKKARKVAY